jgi:hypothetical protein
MTHSANKSQKKGFLGAETEQELDTSRERHEEKIQGA